MLGDVWFFIVPFIGHHFPYGFSKLNLKKNLTLTLFLSGVFLFLFFFFLFY
jgi:hypothetical protein